MTADIIRSCPHMCDACLDATGAFTALKHAFRLHERQLTLQNVPLPNTVPLNLCPTHERELTRSFAFAPDRSTN